MAQEEAKEKMTFVTVELSKKQVDMKHVHHNENNGKDYLRIYAPGGGVLFYPAESIKVKDEKRVYFSRPLGTELQLSYSDRIPNVPDTAPDEEKYNKYTRTVKIEDLKEMYEEERRAYAESVGFHNMTVPTKWGHGFTSNDKEYVSVSIPIREGERDVYYSFIVPAEKFKESTREEGMSYFGFPKKNKEDSTKDYMVELRTSEKNEEDEYVERSIQVSSLQLKQYVDAAVDRNLIKEMFISTDISEKMVRRFESNEGKKLAGISVPVYEMDDDEKASFYEIVVPQERLRSASKEGYITLSLFRNGPDGNEYNFVAKKSVKNPETDEYEKVPMEMTSQEVINYFNYSAQKFREERSNETGRTLADELAEGESHTEPQKQQNEAETAEQNQNQSYRPQRRFGGGR